jgi:hypothetical protein
MSKFDLPQVEKISVWDAPKTKGYDNVQPDQIPSLITDKC